MKRAAAVAFILFTVAAATEADPGVRGTNARARSTAASSTGGIWSCDPTPSPAVYAQTDPSEKRGCVALHEDRTAKARVFASDSVFANVCPIVVRKNFIYDANCTGAGVVLPQIVKGDTMNLRFRDGSYWLSIDGASGSILAGVKLDPEYIKLGTDAEKVEGYAWLKGSNGRVVYYVYIDGVNTSSVDKHEKKFIVEMYDAANTACAHHAPSVSAVQDKNCDIVPAEDPFVGQGGTGPGGEPPPTKK
jgi:hypothetical protein